MKVLSVDDNPMAGILLSDILHELGHDSLVAEDGAAAMALFEREEPQVCVLDWMMPDMDGLQLACAIRKHRRGAGVYIIMLSAKQDCESIDLAYELGVDDFVTKPVAAGELQARLRAATRLITLRDEYASKCEEVAALSAAIDRLRAAA